MPWVPLDDRFHSNPKVLAAGNAAVGLYVRLVAWSADELTDGFIPDAVANAFGTAKEIAALANARRTPTGEGLIVPADGGWQIVGYLDRNPTGDEVRERRAAANQAKADAGRRGGIASGAARRAKRDRSTSEAEPEADSQQNEPLHLHLHLQPTTTNPPPALDPPTDQPPDGGGGGELFHKTAMQIAGRAARLLLQNPTVGAGVTNHPAWVRSVAGRLARDHRDDLYRFAGYVETGGSTVDDAARTLANLSLRPSPVLDGADGPDAAEQRQTATGRHYGLSVANAHAANGEPPDPDALAAEVANQPAPFRAAALAAYLNHPFTQRKEA